MSLRDEREKLRLAYRPPRVRLLFVAESAPLNVKTFFYAKSGHLYPRTREAFEAAGAPWAPERGKDFLEHFRGMECYLVDLCPPGATVKTRASSLAEDIERLS